MSTSHSIKDLKSYHNQAIEFFGTELMLLKEVVPKIKDDRLQKVAVLLISCGQTGTALIQLSTQPDNFTSEAMMLSRAFMEKITNFVYVGICDEKEYRAFLLHPIYKYYHSINTLKIEDDFILFDKNAGNRKKKQDELKKNPIIKEALSIFSEDKPYLNWTKKTLNDRILKIQEWGKLLDIFFTINKINYYSDASETLHGSLYGCTYGIGAFNPEFDYSIGNELEKKLYKDNASVLLHLGMLIHESFTLINYTNDIEEIWNLSYNNRNQAVNLLFHLLEKKIPFKS